MSLYVGLDSSTQSLTAVVVEIAGDTRRAVLETSLNFDEALPQYGTRHGVMPQTDSTISVSSPLMWAEALDLMMARLARSGIDVARIAAISGSAQQHGSVYLNATAARTLETLDPGRPLVGQLRGSLSRDTAPIWMDSSTAAECAEITAAVGGDTLLATRTGSTAFERFTAPQIRRFFKQSPAAYAATDRIHLVSSFVASLLTGRHAPLEPGDASGMNLMDLATRDWWSEALDATAPNLARKLPPIVAPWTVVGTLAPYWRLRYGLPEARVVAWTGDNPSSLVGVGLVREGGLAVSLGTSDTVFGPMSAPRVTPDAGHVFGAPTGAYMGLTCFQNGSLARERVRESHRLTWEEFSAALDRTPAGNGGRLMLPWFGPEITPRVCAPSVHWFGPRASDAPTEVRAIVEAQLLSMALHSQWIATPVQAIHATGGAAANRAMLQVMADVFGADVYQLAVRNSAALGAALRAAHGHLNREGHQVGWEDLLAGLAQPAADSRLRPDPRRHAVYREILPAYAACEAYALGRGPDPRGLIGRIQTLPV